jgi:hypothetical protein
LTSDFSLPANNGAGVIVPGLVAGDSVCDKPPGPAGSADSARAAERALGGLTNDFVVNRPRETGLRLAYMF